MAKGVGTLVEAGGQALQGNWEEAGKLALKGAGDVVGAASTIALTVGTVALAVGTGGSSLAALSVAGIAFAIAKGTAIAEMAIGGAEVVVGAMTGDLDYAMEGATDIVAGFMKKATANKSIAKVDTEQILVQNKINLENKYGPHNPHPTLSEDIQNSFSGGIFAEQMLPEDTVLYRVKVPIVMELDDI